MSKINDYNEKCLEELYTELDAQKEHEEMMYSKMQEALVLIQEVLDSTRSDWGKTVIISKIIKDLKNG